MAAVAPARLVPAEADHAGARAGQGGDWALGAGDLARGKKNAARRRATVVFLDESGFSETPSVRATWAPRGQTPVLIHRLNRWQRLSAIGALAYAPHRRTRAARARLLLALQPTNVCTPDLVRFLRHLHRHLAGPVVLLWDGLAAHRSHAMREFLATQTAWLTVLRLPAYAPELNPVEGVWAWFKGSVVPNFCPLSLDPIRRELRLGQQRLRRTPDRLRGFLHKAGLSLD